MDIKYHRKSLELINCKPEFSGNTFPNLPASVAEWFSLVNGVQLLEKYSNQDAPVPPSEFKTCKYNDTELVVFMYENQGVLWWAFENCNNDDPPIYINLDPPPDNWVRCDDLFSKFVYTWLFDHLHWFEKDLFIMKTVGPLENDILEILHKEYVEEPSSIGLVGLLQYRFSNNDQKISITSDNTHSTWMFSADSSESLNKVYSRFEYLLKEE